jgi:hypothetical protein
MEIQFESFHAKKYMQRHQLFPIFSCKTESTPEKADLLVVVLGRYNFTENPDTHTGAALCAFFYKQLSKTECEERKSKKPSDAHGSHWSRVSTYLYPGVVGRPCGFAKRVESNCSFSLRPNYFLAFRGSISCFIDS